MFKSELRIGIPILNGGKKWLPVQQSYEAFIIVFGSVTYFTSWRDIDFFQTEKEARFFINGKNISNRQPQR